MKSDEPKEPIDTGNIWTLELDRKRREQRRRDEAAKQLVEDLRAILEELLEKQVAMLTDQEYADFRQRQEDARLAFENALGPVLDPDDCDPDPFLAADIEAGWKRIPRHPSSLDSDDIEYPVAAMATWDELDAIYRDRGHDGVMELGYDFDDDDEMSAGYDDSDECAYDEED